MVLIRKNKRGVSHLNQIWMKKTLVNTLMYILTKKNWFQTVYYLKQIKIFIEMVISMAVDCKNMEIYGKSDGRQRKD